MVLPILPVAADSAEPCLMSLVPEGSNVPETARQRENGPAQAVGVGGDVDRVNAVVVSNADLQQ